MAINTGGQERGLSQPVDNLQLEPAEVVDIILDINHPLAQEYGNYDAIGTIFYAEVYIKEGEDQALFKYKVTPRENASILEYEKIWRIGSNPLVRIFSSLFTLCLFNCISTPFFFISFASAIVIFSI